jgi:hypothetical protein
LIKRLRGQDFDPHKDEPPLKEIQAAHDVSKPLDGLTVPKRGQAMKSICQELMKHD